MDCNVTLKKDLRLRFKVPEGFISRYSFVRVPIEHECLRCTLNGNVLNFLVMSPTARGVLNGPNGVLSKLAKTDGSFAGSVPHDVVWEFAKVLAKLWNVDVSLVRRFGDELYVNTTFTYGGKTFWTRLANRFCFRVAFPFGNFLKKHNLGIPNVTAPLIVIALFPAALVMFLFNRRHHDLTFVGERPNVYLDVDGDDVVLVPKSR